MDYKKMWDTLKAESGYRITEIGSGFIRAEEKISELMEAIEEREKCQSKQQPTGANRH